MNALYAIANVDEIDSPALLIYADLVETNVRRMLAIAGDPAKLCPHVKTHKMAPLVRVQMAQGIRKFKCATIAEAEMCAMCGVQDVLLAYQPVGPKVERLFQLIRKYPGTSFAAVFDDAGTIRAAGTAAASAGVKLKALLDVDSGMKRTGIAPGPEAIALYRLLATQPGLVATGLHAYDGHMDDPDPVARKVKCDAAFAPVAQMNQELRRAGLPAPRLVVGGTPAFAIHAERSGVECSPGTCVLWDAGYAASCPDLGFVPAALVLTRVVSRPSPSRLCLDLGHKAIASEKPHPRVEFLNFPNSEAVMHSEEHLVIETPRAAEFPVGTVLYGVPRHICPTVALHAEAVVVRTGRAVDRWPVDARQRRLTC